MSQPLSSPIHDNENGCTMNTFPTIDADADFVLKLQEIWLVDKVNRSRKTVSEKRCDELRSNFLFVVENNARHRIESQRLRDEVLKICSIFVTYLIENSDRFENGGNDGAVVVINPLVVLPPELACHFRGSKRHTYANAVCQRLSYSSNLPICVTWRRSSFQVTIDSYFNVCNDNDDSDDNEDSRE